MWSWRNWGRRRAGHFFIVIQMLRRRAGHFFTCSHGGYYWRWRWLWRWQREFPCHRRRGYGRSRTPSPSFDRVLVHGAIIVPDGPVQGSVDVCRGVVILIGVCPEYLTWRLCDIFKARAMAFHPLVLDRVHNLWSEVVATVLMESYGHGKHITVVFVVANSLACPALNRDIGASVVSRWVWHWTTLAAMIGLLHPPTLWRPSENGLYSS